MRAALYPRVSTDEQAKFGLSIHDQQENLEKYAKEHKMTVVGIYADEGFSARKKIEQRPAMLRLLEDVKAGKIDIILVTKLDRWFRNIGEYYKVQEILEAHNVSWKTIYEDYDTSTASGRLKINIMLAVAQDEADRTSERIKKVFEGKRLRNETCTGQVPIGYTVQDKRVIIDPTTEPYIRKFFAKFLETGSIHSAIYAAPELDLQYQTASKLLSRTAYRGVWNGISIPPYLTIAEYEQIQSMRRRVSRKTNGWKTYVFSGMLVCGECGRRMGGRSRLRDSGYDSYSYNCPGCYQYKGCPNHVNIVETKIEKYLLETIDEKINIIANAKGSQEPVINTEAQEKSLKKKISKLSDLYLDDLISKEEYAKRYEDLTEQLQAIEAARSKAPAKTPEELSEAFFTGWQDIYSNLSRENKKTFWKLKLKEIRVYKDRRIDFDFL